MSDRINKVVLGPYDQVVALTQYMINSGLQGQYDWAVSQGYSKPSDITLKKFGSQGFYETIMGPSRVIINYAPGDLSSCTFQMIITSGQLRIYASTADGDDRVTCFPLNNFKLACPVNMGLAGLDPNSEDYKRIRALMNQPGDYSIKQLMVDLKTAQTKVLNDSDCDFGKWTEGDWILKAMDTKTPPEGAAEGADWKRPPGWALGQPRTLSEGIRTNLKTLFNYALTGKVAESASGQLGFVADGTSSGQGHQAHFVPSDVRFQTYPWIDSAGKTYTGYGGNGDLNYLLYCEMVDNKTPPGPADPNAILQPLGNWTDGTQPGIEGIQEFGSYVLSRGRFLEEWFLPHMKKINRTMSAVYSSPSMDFHGNLVKWWCTFNFSIIIGAGCQAYGVADPEDDKYNMTSQTSVPARVTEIANAIGKSDFFSTAPSNALFWYYWNSDSETAPITNWKQHDEDYGNKCDSRAKVHCASRLMLVPGQNTLVLEGVSYLDFGYYVDPGVLEPNVDQGNRAYQNWKVTFTLQEVSDGGLAIAISEPEVKITWLQTASGWTYSSGPKKDQPYDIHATFKEYFDQAGTNLVSLVHGLKNMLQGNDRFYFPSRGRFFFKDPQFTHAGDLIAKCAYNGNETGDANPSAGARDLSKAPSFQQISEMTPGESSKTGKSSSE